MRTAKLLEQPPLWDDSTRCIPEADMISCLRTIKRLWSRTNGGVDASKVQVLELLTLPTQKRLKKALGTQFGRTALQETGMSTYEVLHKYDKILPCVIPVMYQQMHHDLRPPYDDLPRRFAQALFDTDNLPTADGRVRQSLLKKLGVGEEDFRETVAQKAFHYAAGRLHKLVQERRIDRNLLLQFEQASDSAAWLNHVLAHAKDEIAMEILNAIELAGYWPDDPLLIEEISKVEVPEATLNPV